jgi:soluble lytic murein transglycosylase-like protein
VLAALGLFLGLSPGAAFAAEVWGYGEKRFLASLRSDPGAFFDEIDSSRIVPRQTLALGPDAPYYCGVHLRSMDRTADAMRLFRLAAVTAGPEVRPEAKAALLELLLQQGELNEAEHTARRYLAEGKERAEYALALFEALFRRGKAIPLDQALKAYEHLFSAEADPQRRGAYRFYRVFSAYRQEEQGWRRLVAETCARFPEETLPPEWYWFTAESESGESAEEDGFPFPEHGRLEREKLSEGGAALLEAKGRLHRGAYRGAAAEYRVFLERALEDEELRRSFDRVLLDEVVRAALYSGSVYPTLELFERLGRLYPEDALGDGRDEQLRQLYWIMETRGYLYRRAGRFRSAAEDYAAALKLAPEGDRERMRWYRYDSILRFSTSRALAELPGIVHAWENPAYYDDVLFDLADRLVEERKWREIAGVADLLMDQKGSFGGSRFTYLAARAAETGLYEASEEKITAWYRSAAENGCGVGAGLYYRIMAAERLTARGAEHGGLYGSARTAAVPPFCGNAPPEGGHGSGARALIEAQERKTLIRGCLRYGLADFAYERYGTQEELLVRLDAMTVRRWAAALQEGGAYLRSIRVLADYLRLRGGPVSLAEAKMLYPRPYGSNFSEISVEYGLPEHIFYALVREESYFDASISSAAGAVGLAQLMPSTARDIASRIGLRSYELTDPAVNLRLGGWYLDHLASRTDTYLRALLAYNGGLTRVRRWSGTHDGLPEDLLLEAVPYAETKHYGRKVLVSSVIYGYLYHGRSPSNVVETIFGTFENE